MAVTVRVRYVRVRGGGNPRCEESERMAKRGLVGRWNILRTVGIVGWGLHSRVISSGMETVVLEFIRCYDLMRRVRCLGHILFPGTGDDLTITWQEGQEILYVNGLEYRYLDR